MKAIALSAAVLLASAGLAAPVLAQGDLTVRGSRSAPAEDDATIRVPYGDLSLANASDGEVLRTRVHQAIRKGCGNLYGSTQPSQEWACRDVAWNAASPQVSEAIAAAQSGRTLAARTMVLRFARR